MLKFEKIKKSQNVAIRLREKERAFSRSFLLAILIAGLLHLLAFIVFKIDTPDFHECQAVADPAVVDVDIHHNPSHESTQSILAGVAAVLPHHILEPEPSLPKKPQCVSSRCEIKPMFLNEPETSPNFQPVERLSYDPGSMEFGFSQSYLPVSFTVSGPLANHTLLDNEAKILQTSHLTQKPTKRKRITYHVRLDNRSGRIFWFEKEKNLADETDRLATVILKKMRFIPQPQRSAFLTVTEGIIEITLEIEEGRMWDEHLRELEKS